MRKVKRTSSSKLYKILIALFILAIGGIFYLVHTGYIHHKVQQVAEWYHDTTAGVGFVVENVLVEGNNLTTL